MTRKQLSFSKMHGIGNDFVVVDHRGQRDRISSDVARRIADRHTGVGFDQLIEILDSTQSDIRLVFWNADGSEAGACGNGTRCAAAKVMDATGSDTLTMETSRGQLIGKTTEHGVSINMGDPLLNWDQVPLAQDVDPQNLPLDGAPVAVGMGNPHAVFFIDDAENCDPAIRGPIVERDPLFPKGTNVEFASLTAPDRIRMRVWERGAGITRACGSGACATAVAAHLRGMTGRKVWLDLDGGSLLIDWRNDGVWMTGATAHVFDGLLMQDWVDG